MIETKPGISINQSARWIYQGSEITHEGVLLYFRQNLYREDNRYFILNKHGDGMEKAWLDSVDSFPLAAVSALFDQTRIDLLLETGERVLIDREKVYARGENVLFFFHPDRGIPVRLRASAMVQTMDAVDEVAGRLVWRDAEPLAVYEGRLFG